VHPGGPGRGPDGTVSAGHTSPAADTADTIAAVATGARSSHTAIIRISGPACASVLESCFLQRPAPVPHRPGRLLDDASLALPAAGEPARRLPVPVRAIFMPAPRTFTGQDTLEILLPGNPHLLSRVMAMVLAVPGVRAAGPGEFAARAYLAGKMTLQEAESIAAVIAAQSQTQLRAARRVMDGRAGTEFARWAEELATLLALVEAGIDFADQDDVVAIAPDVLRARVAELEMQMRERVGIGGGRIGSTARYASTVRVVLLGEPNAGKSTLFNRLLGRQRSIVSDIAGTTRDVIAEPLELTGPGGRRVSAELVDVAGLIDERAASEAAVTDMADTDFAGPEAAEAARDAVQTADVLLLVRACGTAPSPQLASLAEQLRQRGTTVLGIMTKADQAGLLGSGHDRAAAGELPVCGLDGFGLEPLHAALLDATWRATGHGDGLLPRHQEAVLESLDTLRGLLHAARGGRGDGPDGIRPDEFAAASVRAALDALGELTGKVHRDEIIGRIFATFCIGK